MVSSVVQKLFKFNVVLLIYCCFCFSCCWSQIHKNIPKTKVQELSAYVSSMYFIISGLFNPFKFLIYFCVLWKIVD